MKWIENSVAWVNRGALAAGGVAVLFMMIIAAGNVIMRLLGAPIQGAYELAGFCGALLVALALGETQRRKEHVAVDILTRRFPLWLQSAINGLRYIVFALFFLFLAWELFKWGGHVRDSGEVSETLKIQYYPVIYGVAAGLALLAVNLAVDFILLFKKKTQSE